MADKGHEETEEVLKELEKEVWKTYLQAQKELQEKLEDYFRRFEIKDKLKRKALDHGLITEAEYKKWRKGQLLIGKRWEEMRDTIAEDLTHTAEIAQGIANDYMPEVYAINHAYGTFQVEKTALVNTSYTLYDKHTFQRMFKDVEMYHEPGWTVKKHINEGKLLDWNKKEVQSVMAQSILQGESIPKMAQRLQNAVGNSILEDDIKNRAKMTAEQISKELVRLNRNASIRNARTMATGTQNAGRVDSYKRAEDMGIELMQEWMATLDGRTRHEHRVLDGERVKVGDKFKVNGDYIEYPGDPNAPGYLIYNCRCTLVPCLKGFEEDASNLRLRNTNHMEELTYEEWKEAHPSHSDPIDKQVKMAEKMKAIYGAEYRKYSKLR